METYHPRKIPLRLWTIKVDHCLEERTHTDTEEKQPWEGRSKDWSDVATARKCQEPPETGNGRKCQEPPETGNGKEGSFPRAFRQGMALP